MRHHPSGKRRLMKQIFAFCIVFCLICGISVQSLALEDGTITAETTAEATSQQEVKPTDEETKSVAPETASSSQQMETESSQDDSNGTSDTSSEDSGDTEKDTITEPTVKTNGDTTEEMTGTDKEEAVNQDSTQADESDGESEGTTETTAAAKAKTMESGNYKGGKPGSGGDSGSGSGDSSNDKTYNLYCYTLIPGVSEGSSTDANQVWNGMGIGAISDVTDPSKVEIETQIYTESTISDATITYPTSYPSIRVDGTVYQYAEKGSENADEKGYYTITWTRVVCSNGANAGNNNYNPTVNSGTHTYHLDGYIILNETDKYTISFKLKDAGEDNFNTVDPETYSKRVNADTIITTSNTKIPTVTNSTTYPQTKTVGGIEYEFDGWYTNEQCTENVDFDTGYTVTHNTTFYGKYVPKVGNLTVKKEVTGELGDKTKKFQFTYSYKDKAGEEITNTETISVANGESFTVKNVPLNTQITINEINAAGYSTSAKYENNNVSISVSGEKAKDKKSMEITITENTTIIVNNNKAYQPDTGIRLSSWLYVGSLIIIAVVFVFLVVKRKRHYL